MLVLGSEILMKQYIILPLLRSSMTSLRPPSPAKTKNGILVNGRTVIGDEIRIKKSLSQLSSSPTCTHDFQVIRLAFVGEECPGRECERVRWIRIENECITGLTKSSYWTPQDDLPISLWVIQHRLIRLQDRVLVLSQVYSHGETRTTISKRRTKSLSRNSVVVTRMSSYGIACQKDKQRTPDEPV